ncbi:MAG: endonuclease/exonuclease/phosphatase family protein [Melioribacteraceae bacterium]|nr:endonuclease/exonuclease/phosphatase family protein [Melioribacteraceae bacterium]
MKIKIILFILLLSFQFHFAQEKVRFMSYNLLRYPTNSGADREDSFRKIIDEIDPDILAFQEMTTTNGVTQFIENVLGEEYRAGYFRNNPSTDIDNGLYFKDSLFTVLKFDYLPTVLRDIPQYTLKHNITNDTLIVFVVHLKAGNTNSDSQQRFNEINQLRLKTDTFRDGVNYIVCGDFNLYTSSETAYQRLVDQSTSGYFIDPLRTGSWHDSQNYADIHTQSTRTGATPNNDGGSTGGMDDRFDFIMLSQAVIDSGGITYSNNSYTTPGNDGQHFNKSINDAPFDLSDLSFLNALYLASDHLPVHIDLEFEVPTFVESADHIPETVTLYQNYPNPFNPSTEIKFSVGRREFGRILVTDVLGNEVSELFSGELNPGIHIVRFSAKNLASGIYFYSIITESDYLTRKMLYLK